MLNYVSAEFYKVFRRKYPYVTFMIMATLAALLCSGYIFTNAHGNNVDFYSGGVSVVMVLSVGLYAAILMGDMVFSDQYKFNTLKNEVSFGVPRARIYLGKLAVETVMGVGLSVLLIVFYEALCFFTLPSSSPENTKLTLELVGYCVLAALPQWLGMLALTNMFFFLMRSNTLASFLTVGVIVVPGTAFELTALLFWTSLPHVAQALMTLKSLMPWDMIDMAYHVVGDWGFMAKSWLVGAVWVAATSAIGLAGFRRKEIN